jgi:iron complex outermembrane receptor protein
MFKNRLMGLWLVSVCVMANAAEPIAGKLAAQINFDIPAQPLGVSLKQLADEAGIQILFEERIVRDVQAPALKARQSVSQALDFLLSNTGLEYTSKGSTVAVRKKGQPNTSTLGGSQGNVSPSFNPTLGTQQSTDRRDAVSDDAAKLTEIIVTAEKRNERLQDVPVPVTVISAQKLVDNNQARIQDYYTSVPGLSVAPESQTSQLLIIRGISTGNGTDPTVGITIDDVPYGASTNLAGGLVVPDMDPGDLARVEILRGPQGTLYGASSMGGLLKFVTVDPSTESLSGRVEAGTSSVYNGAELGYNARGSINVPLGETFAIRASAFTRLDPGYIDNPVLGIDGVNVQRSDGGRLATLWRPSDSLSLKLSALYQTTRGDGSSDVDNSSIPGYVGPPLGDLQQNYIRWVGGIGRNEREVQIYTATLNAKLGSGELTSVSGYSVNQYSDSLDFTSAFGSGAPYAFGSRIPKFTQEIRFSMPLGPSVDWLVGAFYTHEKSTVSQDILASDTGTGADVGLWESYRSPSTYQEYAVFSDFTFHITDQFDIQVGGRESDIRQTFTATEAGPLVGGEVVIPQIDSKANAFTYLLTPRFKISPDLMVYARLASGYRPGGTNSSPGSPLEYNPDKTENYELGVKGDFIDHKLSVDASVYYIGWKNLQLSILPANNIYYTSNASEAKSQGVELSIESRPLAGLTLATWVAWNDAELTKDFPLDSTVYGVTGNRLPYSSKFSGNSSVQQDFPISSGVTGFVGGSLSYVGDRQGEFQALQPPGSPQRQIYPAYAKTDLHAGMTYESWRINFYANNVADKRGLIGGGIGNFPPFAYQIIQPRTIGLSLSRHFE